jgi:tetratricopeptide (TPR) repeat protein
VGDNKSGIEPVSDEPSRYERTVKALQEGWDYVGIGNSHYQAGRYEEAAEAYKKAYDVDPGNRVFTGLTLIDAYERLSRYDDALSILDELSKTQPISDYGVEKYAAVRARLLAAKNQPAQAE